MLTCPVCSCPMSLINPSTCQNCDYQLGWSQSEIEAYQLDLEAIELDLEAIELGYNDGF